MIPRTRPIVCTLAVLASLGAGSTQAQIAGGDLSAGVWAFLHSEHERWPVLGGRLRFGAPTARTQVALLASLAFDPVFGGSWQELGGALLYEPGTLGGHRWSLGGGYSTLYASGGAASGFAHAAHALLGLRLGRGRESKWELVGRLLIGPSRRRDDGSREPVRYLAVAVARRLGR